MAGKPIANPLPQVAAGATLPVDSTNLLNPNISLGFCFYGPNQPAAANFIPCGNYAYGTMSCCQAGDNCLSSNACFNYRGGITYIAGCTDATYGSPQCPNKGDYPNQQWSGIVRCDVKAGTWTNCKEDDGSTTVQNANDKCSCKGRRPLFTDSASLEQLAGLPLALGQQIQWAANYTPAATAPVMTPTVSLAPTGSGTSGTSSPSNTFGVLPVPQSSGQQTSGLTHGAAIGVGVGSGLGFMLVGGLVFLAFIMRRRRRAQDQESGKYAPFSGDRGSGEYKAMGDQPVSTWQGDTAVAGTLEDPVMSGFKSELPANDVPKSPPQELDGKTPPGWTPSSPSVRGSEVSPLTPKTNTTATVTDESGTVRSELQGTIPRHAHRHGEPPIAELEG